MKSKKLFIVGILVIIILINIVFLLLLLNYKNNNENQNIEEYYPEEYVNNTDIKTYQYDGKLYPENKEEFIKKYADSQNIDKIYQKLYKFVNNLFGLYSKTNGLSGVEEIKKFYENNKNDLKYKYIVDDNESLTKLIPMLKTVYLDNTNYYKTVKFNVDSYKDNDENIECDLAIIFQDDKELSMKLVVSKDDSTVKLLPNSVK